MKEIEEEKETFEVAVTYPDQPVGWLETKLSKSMMTRLHSYIEDAKKDPINYNHKLVGNISKSLLMEDKDNWFYENMLLPLIQQFVRSFPAHIENVATLTEDAPYCLSKLWVNFQKENEFNPPHDHNGIYSFVIFVKIPTDYKEQHALPFSGNSNNPKASDFEFRHISMLGQFQHTTYYLDKESEGNMLFFPAKLMHQVFPFYNCDKERISISGNISFDVSEEAMSELRIARGRQRVK